MKDQNNNTYSNRELFDAVLKDTGITIDAVLDKCSPFIRGKFNDYLDSDKQLNPISMLLLRELVPDKDRFQNNLNAVYEKYLSSKEGLLLLGVKNE